MKPWRCSRLSFTIVFLAVVALLCVASLSRIAKSASCGAAETNETAIVDFDFTKMNPTMRVTYTYRLASDPTEFSNKVLRVSGVFLTRVDDKDGKRYFGCLLGDSGGCSCCAPGGVLEFMPKDSYVWPTNFPPVRSRIAVTGRVGIFEVGTLEQPLAIPRLVDADISWFSR